MGFEPDPYWDRRLLLPDNVFVFRKALAAKRRTVPLNLNQGKCSSMHYLDTGARPVDVDAITLADAVALAPAERIELVKMDIEGEEVPVLWDASPEIPCEDRSQLTVEFHDFLDAASKPGIRAVIDKLRGLGFFTIRFSWHTYGDVLFVNRRWEPLSLRQRADLTVVHKSMEVVSVGSRIESECVNDLTR